MANLSSGVDVYGTIISSASGVMKAVEHGLFIYTFYEIFPDCCCSTAIAHGRYGRVDVTDFFL